MLEPPTPAGDPFVPEQQNQSASAQDFQQVCISLVERGWKILPKKGAYPVNKPGPRYINLVDPRGNRKTIHVFDEALWEKLREIHANKEKKKQHKKKGNEESKEAPTAPAVETAVSHQPQIETLAQVSVTEPILPIAIETTAVEIPPLLALTEPTLEQVPVASESLAATAIHEEKIDEFKQPPTTPRDIHDSESLRGYLQNIGGLEKSILELGFETLLLAVQTESLLDGTGLEAKVSEWKENARSLIEYIQERQRSKLGALTQPATPAPPIQAPVNDSAEKDELIRELRDKLRQKELDLEEVSRSLEEL